MPGMPLLMEVDAWEDDMRLSACASCAFSCKHAIVLHVGRADYACHHYTDAFTQPAAVFTKAAAAESQELSCKIAHFP